MQSVVTPIYFLFLCLNILSLKLKYTHPDICSISKNPFSVPQEYQKPLLETQSYILTYKRSIRSSTGYRRLNNATQCLKWPMRQSGITVRRLETCLWCPSVRLPPFFFCFFFLCLLFSSHCTGWDFHFTLFMKNELCQPVAVQFAQNLHLRF